MLGHSAVVSRQQGYTLLELVIVLVLVGVMAVSIASRFTSRAGFSEYAYQARLISALRAMQLRAMEHPGGDFCYQINFRTGVNSAFGPGTWDHTDNSSVNSPLSCLTQITTSELARDVVATNAQMQSDEVIITDAPASIRFNSQGCTLNDDDLACETNYEVLLTGASTVKVCVEAQGYVHACD